VTIQATPALLATLATALEPIVVVLADLVIAPVIIPATLSEHFTSPATNQVNPARIQATPALPATLTTTLEPMIGVLADLVIVAPVIIPATLLDHFTSPVTNPVNPATIQATPALPATVATALEPMVGVLTDLVIALMIIPATLLDHFTSPATNPQ
jgi:hypothetical protein